jgi:predicted phage terminase large subunit-like protein
MTPAAPAALLAGADPADARRLLRERIARDDYLEFVKLTARGYRVDPFHAYLATQLQQFVEACERKESPRVILMCPPQHGKSTLSSRHLPPWILGRNPSWRVALMSFNAEWASSLSGDARDTLASEECAGVFPGVALDRSTTAKDEWSLTRKSGGGGMKAVGRDGGITGRPAHVLIIDDFLKNRAEADSDTTRAEINRGYFPNFRTRLQEGAGVLIVATPWHHMDLIGHVLQVARDNPAADQWRVIRLPALAEEHDPMGRAAGEPLAPSRFSLKTLLVTKATADATDGRDWGSLYQCRPTPEEGAIFKRDWFTVEPVPDKPGFILDAWDTAFSEKSAADFTAGWKIRIEGNVYRILDRFKKRVAYPELKLAVRGMATGRHRAGAVLVEDVGSGKSLVQELRASTRLPIVTYRPDRDKVSRAHAVTGICAARRVVLPQGAPWLEDFFDELLRFPAAEHDDQVDALTMALTFAETLPFAAFESREPAYSDFTWDRRETVDGSGLYGDLGLAAPA